MKFSTLLKHSTSATNIRSLLMLVFIFTAGKDMFAQNIFSGEPVQWVGRPNGYGTTPYGSDYRTMAYRKISTMASKPSDGRGQWTTTINVQTSGGNFAPDNMPGGGSSGWLLISGPSSNRFQNKWDFNGIGQGALNAINGVIKQGGGEDMGLNMGTAGYYTFNMRDAGYVNTEFYVGYTSSTPVTVSRSSQSLNNLTNGTTINIATSATPSSGENIYVRYRSTTNDFTTGTSVIQASGSGTSWTAEIPAQACGTTVYYYVYSSTRTLSQTGTDSESDRALSAIRYDDNAGANYSYVANTSIISVSAAANGSITPATGTVTCGEDVVYTITPDNCYGIADVTLDGVSQGAVGSVSLNNVTGNHTIVASFALNSYNITVGAVSNGSITPGTGTVNCGGSAQYFITADPCYHLSDVIVDGQSAGPVPEFTFSDVSEDHTISAVFAVDTYAITATADLNGSITPGSGSVNCGSNNTYTITPSSCYHISEVIVDGQSQGAVDSYTFSDVTSTHSISASFAINTPLASPVVTGPVNVCAYVGSDAEVTYTFSSAGSTGYSYILPPNMTLSASTSNSITVKFLSAFESQANKQLRVTALSDCGNSPQVIFYMVAQGPVTPHPITGNTNVCPVLGTAGTYTYTISSVPAATAYIWIAQAGTTTITHPNGEGVNDTTITVSFSNGFTSSAITVQAANGCGTSSIRSLTVVRANPSAPSPIAGPTNSCPYIGPDGATATYTIASLAGATSYSWTVPAGAIDLTGQGTPSISFKYPSGFVSGQLSVTATNGCGTGAARTLSINKLNPSAPGVIDIIQTSDCPDRVFSYTIAALPSNSTSLQWTVPAGATLVSGQGTNSITVSYPSTSITGNVTAQAFSNCGSSSIRVSSVRLAACPPDDGPPPPAPFAKAGTLVPATAAGLAVNVFPNPSTADFKVQVLTAGKEKISVRIMDMQGRDVKELVVMPYQMVNIGNELKAGSYMLEVRQGGSVKTTKLLKF